MFSWLRKWLDTWFKKDMQREAILSLHEKKRKMVVPWANANNEIVWALDDMRLNWGYGHTLKDQIRTIAQDLGGDCHASYNGTRGCVEISDSDGIFLRMRIHFSESVPYAATVFLKSVADDGHVKKVVHEHLPKFSLYFENVDLVYM